MGIALARRTECLLLALLVPVATAVAAQPAAPQATRAAQFDQVLQRVVGPASMDAVPEAYEADLDRLHQLLPAGDRARAVQFRSVYCTSARWKDPRQGLAYADEALRQASAMHDLASQGRARFCRATFLSSTQGLQQSIAEWTRAIALLEGSPERQLLAEMYVARGSDYSARGEQAHALLDFQRARAGFRAAGIHHEIDALMLQIAVTYRRIGSWAQAERYFTQALAKQRAQQHWSQVITYLVQLGWLHEESGDSHKAAAAFQQAIDTALQHRKPEDLGNPRLGLAWSQTSLGLADAALATLATLQQDPAAGAEDIHGILLMASGRALAAKGLHRAALQHYQEARPLIERGGNLRYLSTLYLAQSSSEEALGMDKQALANLKHYSSLHQDLQQKMRLEQSRLLDYESEIQRRDFENQRLRAEARSQQQQVQSLQRERRWQLLALGFGVLLTLLLVILIWRQLRHARRLRLQAMTDLLTQTMSRRAIEAVLDDSLRSAHQTQQPLAVMLLDLDYFKAVNDRYGHPAGDRVLRDAAAHWKEQLRNQDALGRFGGEEFLVVCPDADLAQAQAIATRLLDATRTLRFAGIAADFRITTSIGIAQALPADSRETLLARADTLLYQAKQQGRDRVMA